jgi:hypothetical protein
LIPFSSLLFHAAVLLLFPLHSAVSDFAAAAMIRISKLEKSISFDELKAILSNFGDVDRVDLNPSNSRALVRFSTPEETEKCFEIFKRNGYFVKMVEIDDDGADSGVGSSRLGDWSNEDWVEDLPSDHGFDNFAEPDVLQSDRSRSKPDENTKMTTRQQSFAEKSILITNLPRGTTRAQVQQKLKKYKGLIRHIRSHNGGEWCFVDFFLHEDARKFLHNFKHGRAQVCWSHSKSRWCKREGQLAADKYVHSGSICHWLILICFRKHSALATCASDEALTPGVVTPKDTETVLPVDQEVPGGLTHIQRMIRDQVKP